MTTEEIYEIFLHHPLVCTDSRQIRGNSLFFALKGENFNGNLYAKAALDMGAAYAVVDDQGMVAGDRYLLVEDVLTTLQQMAHIHRKKLALPVIAVTGTNGKTTTKELTAAVLGSAFNVEYTRGNLNNHIGVPLTLLSMNGKTEIGVVEMGANHPGEIAFLCRIADPDYGLITNIGKAHLEGFGDFEGVVRTKSELYRYISEKSGTIFINGDNPILTSAAGSQKELVVYGSGDNFRLKGEIRNDPPWCSLFLIEKGEKTLVRTKLIGDYNYENILAAATVGLYFGIAIDRIVSALENYAPSNNRSQLLSIGTNQIIMDAYNANPSSMSVSITHFIRMNARSKTIILGDMLELGKESQVEHQRIVDLLADVPQVDVFLVGNNFIRTTRPGKFHTFPDTDELMKWLFDHPLRGKTILIKGSRGIRLERVVSVFS